MKPLETTALLLRQRWHRARRADALRDMRKSQRNGLMNRAYGCESAARHWSRRLCRDLYFYAYLTFGRPVFELT